MPELLERLAADVGGRYVIEGELGRGGMATVYLARDLRDERRVAIKVLDPELAAAVGGERFRREIAIVQRLQHPNILGIHESGEAGGSLYYVMPYVSGESLRARLDRERQLPLEDAIQLATEVALALDYAHQQGVVHRDIKPENILLEDGHAIVADFGIARAAGAVDNATLTKTGVAIGTPQYMSPEQILANKGEVDGRTDEYALACMLYEMLAGQPPFVATQLQALMAAHVLDLPQLVTRHRQSTPPNVENALIKALAKDKLDRFPTLGDFAAALENPSFTTIMRATYTSAVPTPASAPAPAWKRVMPIVAAMVLGVAATGGAWQLWVKDKAAATLVSPEEIAAAKKIAVLYFKAADSTLAPVADGLTETLIDRLRQVEVLDVRSRSGVARFRGSALGADSIGRLLDVGRVVEGEVRRDGDQLRVDVRLLDPRSGATVDNLSVTEPRGDLLAMRGSLAEKVAELLRQQVGKELQLKEQQASTGSQEAWLVLQRAERARKDADAMYAAGDTVRAIAAMRSSDSLALRAASLDAAWSAPHATRSAGSVRRAEWSVSADPGLAASWLDSAIAQAGEALRRDPANADAMELRGTARFIKSRIGAVRGTKENRALVAMAEADLDTATQLDPTRASAYNTLSRLKYAVGDVTSASTLAQKALEKDAFLANAAAIRFRLFATAYDRGEWIEARRACDVGGRQYADDARFVECRLLLLLARDSVPRPEGAWPLVARYVALSPKPQAEYSRRYAQILVAGALGRAGLRDSASRVLERSRADASIDSRGELVGYEALVRGQYGDVGEAINLIQRYIAEHPEHRAGFTGSSNWLWQPLRQDPRFRAIATLTR